MIFFTAEDIGPQPASKCWSTNSEWFSAQLFSSALSCVAKIAYLRAGTREWNEIRISKKLVIVPLRITTILKTTVDFHYFSEKLHWISASLMSCVRYVRFCFTLVLALKILFYHFFPWKTFKLKWKSCDSFFFSFLAWFSTLKQALSLYSYILPVIEFSSCRKNNLSGCVPIPEERWCEHLFSVPVITLSARSPYISGSSS